MLKSMLILLTGGVFAQIFPLLLSPVLARMYDQEQFGLLANVIATSTVISIIATLRLEFAFLKLKNKSLRRSLVNYITLQSIGISLVLITVYASMSSMPVSEALLIWIVAIFLSNVQILNNFWNSEGLFKEISILRAFQSIAISTFALIFGLVGFHHGLIYPYIIASSFLLVFTYQHLSPSFKFLKKQAILRFLIRSKNYILWSTPSDSINAGYNIGLFALLSLYFQPAEVGIFFLATRVLRSPIILFNQVLSNIYIAHVTKIDIYSSTHIKYIFFIQFIAALFTVTYLFALFFMDSFWIIIFGPVWADLGDYVLILWFYLIANSAYTSISQVANWMQLQRLLFLFNFMNLLITIVMLITTNYSLLDFLEVHSYLLGTMFLCLNFYVTLRIWRQMHEKAY